MRTKLALLDNKAKTTTIKKVTLCYFIVRRKMGFSFDLPGTERL